MFPDEIIHILKKHQNLNSNHILNINKNIEDIISCLYSVNESIANKTKELLTDINTDNEATELLKDSIDLRKYISTIKFIDIGELADDNKGNANFENELSHSLTQVPIFEKKVYPFLISDDICPFCIVKLQQYTIYYQRKINNKITNDTVKWNKCPNCNKMFAIDYDIEDFDFENTNILLNRTKYNQIPEINIYSVIVLSNTLYCSSKHKTQDLLANIPVIDEDGEFSYIKINASYCFECERFTILKEDFNSIKDVIMCKIIDETTECQHSENNEFDTEQKISVLFQYGYNVQTKRNLSEKQRHIILASIIEANIANRRDVTNHINTLIERGSKIKSWKEATTKWKADKKFVSEYKGNRLPEVIFNNIILKYQNKSKQNEDI